MTDTSHKRGLLPGFFPMAGKLLLLVLLTAASLPLQAQTGMVRGTVRGPRGEVISGVTVVIKGTTTGTTTGSDGKYAVQANKGATLVFSHLTYETLERTVTGPTLDVSLMDGATQMEELVVIGYGTQRKRDVTGAITSISASEIERKMPSTVFDALQGQAAGVQIIQGSGQPGEPASIQIRGASTFSSEGVAPLYIVDGAPMDNIEGINPNDIASLEVLKDAASTAIYGSRSANGVIIITTKSGQKGKPAVEVKYHHAWSQLTHKVAQANRGERLYYDNLRRDYFLANPVGGNANESIQMIQDTLNVFFNVDNDYQKLAFQTGKTDQVDVSVSGAENKIKYLAATSYYNETGIIPNTGFKRFTARVNAGYTPSKFLSMGTNFSLGYSRRSGIDEAAFLNSMLTRRPYFSLWFPDGTMVGIFNGQRSPLAQTTYTTEFTDYYRANFFQFFELNLAKGLKFRTNLNAGYNQSKRVQAIPSIITDEWQNSNSAQAQNYLNWNWMSENFLTYSKKFCNVHNFSAMAGMSVQQWQLDTERYRGINSSTDYLWTMNAYAANLDLTNTGTWVSRHSMASFFARLTYDYKGRYLLAANFRRDGSSRFADDSKWGNFPSVSVGWRFSDESFMKWAKPALNDGKIRLSYGVTGNESIGNYDYVYSYTPSTIYDGVGGVAPTRIGLDNLRWEQTEQYNAGLDLNMFNGRMVLTADYYYKYTTGLLAYYQLPKESGFKEMRTNVGEVENQGVEITLSGDLVRTQNWRWNAAFNISLNKNKIARLSEGTPYMSGNLWWMEEGGSLGDLYGYRSLGVFQYDQSNAFTDDWRQLTPVFAGGVFQNAYLLDGQAYTGNVKQKKLPNGKAFRGGDYNWADMTGEGVIDDNDRTVIGNALPKAYGGLSTQVSYKNIALYVAFYYSFGSEVYNDVAHNRNAFQYTGTTPAPEVIYDIWTKQGDQTTYPRPYNDEFNNARYANSFYVEDGSFIRLQNVRLTYTLPEKFTNKFKVKQLGVYAYVNNALTWTNYTGYDPEFSTSDPIQVGKDTNRYPKKREFGLGLNVNF